MKVFKYQDYLSKTRPLGTNCIVVRKSVFDEVGGMRNSTPQTFYGDDTNLLLKVGTYSPCVVIDQPCISAYRLHGEEQHQRCESHRGRYSATGQHGTKWRIQRRQSSPVGPLPIYRRASCFLGGELLLAGWPANFGFEALGRHGGDGDGGDGQQIFKIIPAFRAGNHSPIASSAKPRLV